MQTSVAADELKALIERIERLEEEKSALASDIRDVYSEAKANGFDTEYAKKTMPSVRKRKRFSNCTCKPWACRPDRSDYRMLKPAGAVCVAAGLKPEDNEAVV